MAEVVGLRGQVAIDGRKPRSEVVEVCERLAEEARSGEVVGVMVVKFYHDQSTGMIRVGLQSYSMVGRIEEAKADMLRDLK